MLSIQLGSNVFFNKYPDFTSHDLDYIEFKKDIKVGYRIKIKDCDYFLYPKHWTKEDYISDCKTFPMKVGKFLVPEFNKKINFTIDDLSRLKWLIDKIDDKHSYEKIIYEAYIENQSFTLTEEQRLNAYNEYKAKRKPDS